MADCKKDGEEKGDDKKKLSTADKLVSNFDKPFVFTNILAGALFKAGWETLRAICNVFFAKKK